MKKKFGPAFHGLVLALHDPSFRTQCILALLAIGAGIVLKLDGTEWLAVLICIGLVLTAEIFNTAVEKTCDLISEEYDERIRVIKDLAAGGVLAAALTALVTAGVILIRHLGGIL